MCATSHKLTVCVSGKSRFTSFATRFAVHLTDDWLQYLWDSLKRGKKGLESYHKQCIAFVTLSQRLSFVRVQYLDKLFIAWFSHWIKTWFTFYMKSYKKVWNLIFFMLCKSMQPNLCIALVLINLKFNFFYQCGVSSIEFWFTFRSKHVNFSTQSKGHSFVCVWLLVRFSSRWIPFFDFFLPADQNVKPLLWIHFIFLSVLCCVVSFHLNFEWVYYVSHVTNSRFPLFHVINHHHTGDTVWMLC